MGIEGLKLEAARATHLLGQQRLREGLKLYDLCLRQGKVAGTSEDTAKHQAEGPTGIAKEIAETRKKVQDTLKQPAAADSSCDLRTEVEFLKKENAEMKTEMSEMRKMLEQLQVQVSQSNINLAVEEPPKSDQGKKEESDEDDVDLFGSDSEEEVDEEKARIKQERLDAYAAKKSKKPGTIAKSSIVLDVKPWDDETDMKEMENGVREKTQDGLIWGAAKLVPLAYGIKKLQIGCVVEDEKVSVEELTERICEEMEELVQSVDIAAFNKV